MQLAQITREGFVVAASGLCGIVPNNTVPMVLGPFSLDERPVSFRRNLFAGWRMSRDTPQLRGMKRRTPLGIKLLAIFFAFGACMCALTISLLLFPGSALDSLWRLNPNAHAAFQSLGRMSILLMLIVGVACAFSAIGLARGARWGRWLALIILAVNLIGDLANAMARHDLRTLISLPIGGAMIAYLMRRQER
jgi:uncharacterized membrane protein (DUF2068 family)